MNKLKDENFLILHGTADGKILFQVNAKCLLLIFSNLTSNEICVCLLFVCLAKARVHFQHSAELLNRLVKVDANYSLQLYPDEGHILRDPRSIQHFKRTVVTYFQNCLKHSLFQDPIEDDDEEDDD